jgi:biopolymer transport protein ExbD
VNLRPARPLEEPEVNMTSLIDVVLILVVFFVISTSFVREARLNVALPEAALEPGARVPPTLEVLVDARGRYFVDQQEVVDQSADALARALRQKAGEVKGQTLTIRADGKASHQAVVTVLEVAGQVGFEDIAILTVRPGR